MWDLVVSVPDHCFSFLLFIFISIIFPSSEIIAISICIALYGCSGNNRSNLSELNFDVKFCEIKAVDFQATFLILLAKRRSRGIEKF